MCIWLATGRVTVQLECCRYCHIAGGNVRMLRPTQIHMTMSCRLKTLANSLQRRQTWQRIAKNIRLHHAPGHPARHQETRRDMRVEVVATVRWVTFASSVPPAWCYIISNSSSSSSICPAGWITSHRRPLTMDTHDILSLTLSHRPTWPDLQNILRFVLRLS